MNQYLLEFLIDQDYKVMKFEHNWYMIHQTVIDFAYLF
jgi:hypothetical protein